MYEVQVVYFDEVDEDMDNFGWNMVGTQGGSIASRYRTLMDAINAAERMDLPWVAVCRDMTTLEASKALEEFNEVL